MNARSYPLNCRSNHTTYFGYDMWVGMTVEQNLKKPPSLLHAMENLELFVQHTLRYPDWYNNSPKTSEYESEN